MHFRPQRQPFFCPARWRTCRRQSLHSGIAAKAGANRLAAVTLENTLYLELPTPVA